MTAPGPSTPASSGGAPGSSPAGAVLERDAELTALLGSITGAADGRGSVVLVTGEAGIGKSTLLDTAIAEVEDDARVLRGACDDFLTTRALGPLRDVARQLPGALADAVAWGETGAVLDALLDELDHPLHVTVLVLEDLHWADDATLDVVRFLGRRIDRLRAALWVSFRDGEVGPDHPLRGVLGSVPATTVTRAGLAPLSLGGVRSLTRDTALDPELVRAVTGGNPFFVAELVRSDGTDLPASVSDAVLARVRDLPRSARDALGRLAVLPGAIDHALVATLVAEPADLQEAERRGLLVAAGDGVRFRHELARRAVEQALTTTERAVRHMHVVDALRARDEADASRLLHHALAAGRDDVVIEVGPRAAAEAYRADAHREAAEIQGRLLSRRTRLGPDVLARILAEHVRTLANLIRFDEAYERAVELVELRRPAGGSAARCRDLLLLSRMAWWSGRRDAAVGALDRARRCDAAGRDHDVAAELAVVEAFHALMFTSPTSAVAAAERALRSARDLGRDDLAAHALNYRGCARAIADVADVAGAVEDLQAAIDVGERSGDVDAAARAHLNLMRVIVIQRPDLDVDEVVGRALALIDDHDLAHYRLYLHAHHATHLLDSGRWREAEELLRSLLADVEDGGLFETPVRTALARVAIRTGAADAADLAAVASATAARSGASQYLARARAMLAEMAWLDDDEPTLTRLAAEVEDSDAPALYLAEARRWLARAGRTVAVPADCPEPWATALGGDWRGAAASFAARRQPYEQALELVASDEVAPMLEALTILDDLGALPAARLVRHRLKQLGERPPAGPQRATRDHPLGLTARQAEVLDLLATGATNATIAERLVVSVRTIDNHVSAILRKLGVATREEAVAVASDVPGAAG